MSSRLRPQEFELSLEKSKHTERCAECVTQPTRMLARLTAAVARTLKAPRGTKRLDMGGMQSTLMASQSEGAWCPTGATPLGDILAQPAFGFSIRFPSTVVRWAMEDSQSGHGVSHP
jgi:hypothetical protein